jgi:hypothetical protein
LHRDAKPRLEERLPDLVRQARPDVIVFTGDAINSPAGLPIFKRCMTRLAAIAPTVALRENWDTWYWANLDLFGRTGVRELNGSAIRLEVRANAVWIAGSAAWCNEAPPAT